MKQLFVGLFLFLGLAATPVHAQGLSYSKFHSDITINNDASIKVVETITVDFSTPHHGIFRNIPYALRTLDGGQASIPISIVSVSQDNQAANYTVATDTVNVIVKIGDANRTITGQHIYTITYAAQAATNFFSDHDELYWNVTGDQWDERLTNISATVTFANSVKDVNGTVPTVTQTACYTGITGSTAQNCTHSAPGSSANFSSQDFLTIVVGWPTGFVIKPANFDQLRQSGNVSTETPLDSAMTIIFWAAMVGLPALIVVGAFLFFAVGRRNKDRRPIIAEYEPPVDVRPAEAALLVGVAEQSKMISATIVDLAVRGYVLIEEKESKVFLGLGHAKSFDLVERKKPDAALRPYERQVLDALFRQPDWPAKDGRISLSVFSHHRQDTYEAFETVKATVTAAAMERGWYAMANGWKFWLGPLLTAPGRDLAWKLRGFRLYLQTAEKYRLQWQEKKGIFEKFLPYAMVLGVAKHWSEALAPMMTEPPDWYHGNFSQGFNAAIFYSALGGLSSQMNSTAVSGAASGSSGFSGGSSGGGGGGGGGGGW